MIHVLVVGQTPPPVHGQAVMIERMLRGDYRRVRLHHVRMAFSDSIDDVGRFRLGKLWQLISLVARIVYGRFRYRAKVLYYPPAGPHRVPLYRDIVVLLLTRWLFARTVFHFHASGISQLYPQLSRVERWFFRRAFFWPDVAVRITTRGPNDADFLEPNRVETVPNGITDDFESLSFTENRSNTVVSAGARSRSLIRKSNGSIQNLAGSNSAVACATQDTGAPVNLLFVGMICEGKGVLVLLKACAELALHGVSFRLNLMGRFRDAEFEKQVSAVVRESGIESQVCLLGELTGEQKRMAFREADILCHPSHFDTFPTVLLEAFAAGLPVVATRWRGIPEIVDDGENGFLVDVGDAAELANRIQQLAADPDLRACFGQHAREKFAQQFTVDRFTARMEDVLVAAVG